MIYNNVHQMKAKLASQQAELAQNQRNKASENGLDFQMQMKQMSMQAELSQKIEKPSDSKDAREDAGKKFEAFLNSYVASSKPASLLS